MRPRRTRRFLRLGGAESPSLGNFVVATLTLGILFGAAYVLSHDQPNAGVFLVVSLICVGVAAIFAVVAGAEQLGEALLRRSGRSGREAAVAGLLAISLLTPWSVAIRLAHAAEVPGWRNPIAWLVVLAAGLPFLARRRRWTLAGLAVSGLALAGWLAWQAFQLTRPEFRSLAFPFLPIDLLGTGWYAALIGSVIVVDALAAGDAQNDVTPTSKEVWPLAIVPGMGIARLGLVARGRAWLLAAVFLVVLIQADAYDPQQFAFFGASGGLPEARTRLPAAAIFVVLLLLYAASLWDTRRMIQRLREQAPKLHMLRGRSGKEHLP